MDTDDLSHWKPNDTEQSAAGQLVGHLATGFPLTTKDRLHEIAATVIYTRQILSGSGPAIAPRGRNNVGSLIVSAIQRGRLHELATFAETHSGADESALILQRPSLLADLDEAESALALLAQQLSNISPPMMVR